jgi:proline iminopeptidase
LLLRASFLARRSDIDAFFQHPDAADARSWRAFADVAPPEHRHSLLPWLVQVFANGTPAQQDAAALAWWQWEQRLSAPRSGPRPAPRGAEPHLLESGAGTAAPQPTGDALAALVDRYRVQAHYMHHACWLEAPTLLERCDHVPRVPTLLLHGSADHICPPAGARALHERLGRGRLHWVADAGHNPAFPAMARAMRAALDHYAMHAEFGGAMLDGRDEAPPP